MTDFSSVSSEWTGTGTGPRSQSDAGPGRKPYYSSLSRERGYYSVRDQQLIKCKHANATNLLIKLEKRSI